MPNYGLTKKAKAKYSKLGFYKHKAKPKKSTRAHTSVKRRRMRSVKTLIKRRRFKTSRRFTRKITKFSTRATATLAKNLGAGTKMLYRSFTTLKWLTNRRGLAQLTGTNTPAQLRTMFSTAADVLYFQKNTGAGNQQVYSLDPSIDKFYYTGCKIRYTLMNGTAHRVWCRAYKCIARKDIPLNDPDIAASIHTDDFSFGLASDPNNSIRYGVEWSVFDAPSFVRKYKVLKTYTYNLPLGKEVHLPPLINSRPSIFYYDSVGPDTLYQQYRNCPFYLIEGHGIRGSTDVTMSGKLQNTTANPEVFQVLENPETTASDINYSPGCINIFCHGEYTCVTLGPQSDHRWMSFTAYTNPNTAPFVDSGPLHTYVQTVDPVADATVYEYPDPTKGPTGTINKVDLVPFTNQNVTGPTGFPGP